MFNFFHNLGLGIVSVFVTLTNVFHSQPTSIIQAPTVQASVSNPTPLVVEKKPNPVVNNPKVNSLTTEQVKIQDQPVALKQPQETVVSQTSQNSATQTPATSSPTSTANLKSQQEEHLREIQIQLANDTAQQISSFEAKAQVQKDKDAQQAVQQTISDKQSKLDAINLQIAQLNAKYAQDIKLVGSNGGLNEEAYIAEKNAITETYNEDFNILKAQYQLIVYSN